MIDFFKRSVAKRQTKLVKVAECWSALVPQILSEHCALECFVRGTLAVMVDSSSHLYELKQLLLAGLEEQLLFACKSGIEEDHAASRAVVRRGINQRPKDPVSAVIAESRWSWWRSFCNEGFPPILISAVGIFCAARSGEERAKYCSTSATINTLPGSYPRASCSFAISRAFTDRCLQISTRWSCAWPGPN